MKKGFTKIGLLALLGLLVACGTTTSELPSTTSEEGATTSVEQQVTTEENVTTEEQTTTSSEGTTSEVPPSISEDPVPPSVNYGTEEAPLSVAEAIALTNTLGSTENKTFSTEQGYVTGFVSSISYSTKYSNYTAYIVDSLDDTTVSFQVYGADIAADVDVPVPGDSIVAYGYYCQYYKTPELTGGDGNDYPVIKSVTHHEYTITSTVENGTVAGLPEKGMSGSSYDFTVTPNDGYKIESVKANGEALTSKDEGTYTLVVKGNMTIEVSIVEANAAVAVAAEWAYTAGTTTNLDKVSDMCATVGLSSDVFTISYAAGNSSNIVGLNKDGTTRLYGNAGGIGNSITVSLVDTTKTIKSVLFTFTENASNAVVYAGSTKVSGENGFYEINANSFKLENDNTAGTASKQLKFSKIVIEYYA